MKRSLAFRRAGCGAMGGAVTAIWELKNEPPRIYPPIKPHDLKNRLSSLPYITFRHHHKRLKGKEKMSNYGPADTGHQLALNLEIVVEKEADGVGMGVLNDGTPFLNARGLARPIQFSVATNPLHPLFSIYPFAARPAYETPQRRNTAPRSRRHARRLSRYAGHRGGRAT